MDLVMVDGLDGEVFEYEFDEFSDQKTNGRLKKCGLRFEYCPFCGVKQNDR